MNLLLCARSLPAHIPERTFPPLASEHKLPATGCYSLHLQTCLLFPTQCFSFCFSVPLQYLPLVHPGQRLPILWVIPFICEGTEPRALGSLFDWCSRLYTATPWLAPYPFRVLRSAMPGTVLSTLYTFSYLFLSSTL